MQKNLWKHIFRASRRVSFSYFLQIVGVTRILFKILVYHVTMLGIFVDHVTIFNSSPVQHLRWSSLSQKIGNDWKLLLAVVTRLLDLTLKYIDKFRLRQ